MMIRKKNRGFTLIELLVVMAILGILATIGLVSFRTAQMKGRDARRKHDLEQIEKALEMYYNDKERYPRSSEGIPAGGEEWRDPDELETLYIKSVPADPRGVSYCYASDLTNNGTWYELYAKLENAEDPAIARTCPSECICDGDDTYNYKISSPNAP